MARITRKRRCPTCGLNDFMRYHRRFWMRMFSGSQLLKCRHCRSTILLLRDPRSIDKSAVDET